MIILAVDHGDVRTGVAVCGKNEILASPVAVITERHDDVLAQRIAAIAAERRAELIVVGLPKNMDGSVGFRAQAIGEFAGLLHEVSGLPVVLRDERLSTVNAHQYLNAADVGGKKRKQTVDAVSAVLILEDYLGFRRRTRQDTEA
jgi:putative Holliday junction resolvase